MIELKSPAQFALMREAGRKLYEILTELRARIAPGVTTQKLDQLAEQLIAKCGAVSSFKGYHGFPAVLCTSLDDQVVHGIPDDTPLREGAILSVDAGLVYKGWQADSAFTVGVGEIDEKARALLRVTEECFFLGARQAVAGNRIGDIASAVQTHAESHGYGVIRAMCGHGIGREMHEEPEVPNYGRAGHGLRLRAGMAICIEPMIAMGGYEVNFDKRGIVLTRDHSLCAHYEHTIAITEAGPELLTLPGHTLGGMGA